MEETAQTKAQLIHELAELRQKLAEVDPAEVERKGVKNNLRIKECAIASSISAIALSES